FLDYNDSTQCVQVNSFLFSHNPISRRSPATISSEISPLRCSRTSVGRLLASSILILQLVFSPFLMPPQVINEVIPARFSLVFCCVFIQQSFLIEPSTPMLYL